MSDSLPPHGLQPTRLLCLWNFSGKNTGAGCHVLLHQFPKSANNTRIRTRTFKDNEWRYSSGRKRELPPLSVPHQHPHIRAGRNLRDCLVLPFQASAGDTGLIPGSGRSPGGGHGNPLQYSCLKNSIDRGAWQATVHGISKSWTQLNTTAIILKSILCPGKYDIQHSRKL